MFPWSQILNAIGKEGHWTSRMLNMVTKLSLKACPTLQEIEFVPCFYDEGMLDRNQKGSSVPSKN